ncbi:MAG TPA: hypothetical protein VJV05_02995, partial [Pyrinomonadaceae bacterium]|nr:hypothetical protein [Pyrinomonadaceae bacterium]
MTAGYSGTPLAKKLGIKDGVRVLPVNAPDNYSELLDPLPAHVTVSETPSKELDLIHFFTNGRDELFRGLAV